MNDSGAATGATGFSAAEGAPATASLTSGSTQSLQNASVTSAGSGNGSAQGLQSQNTVANTSIGVAQVGRDSTAPITVSSANQVNVTNTGSASVTTGQALAKGGKATLDQGSTVTGTWNGTGPASASGASTTTTTNVQSPSVTAVGTVVQNNVTASMSSTVTSNGTDGGININHQQAVNLTTSGQASANTSNVSAVATPAPDASAAPTASGLSQVVSAQNQSTTGSTTGTADALGAQVQNSVVTSADARVHIAGSNFAPIQIIIESITNIVNTGVANASTGTASATGADASIKGAAHPGGGGASGVNNTTSASSGSAGAVGAKVGNQVDLKSSTRIDVQGDNHNPIEVFVRMFASIANWGSADATTGGAHATGGAAIASGAGQSGVVNNASNTWANTGNASTLGLSAQNAVNMWAQALVNITGSNYAPITLMIMFETDIQNVGQGASASGDAQSTGAPAVVNGVASDGSPGLSNDGTASSSNSSPGAATSVQGNGRANTATTSSTGGSLNLSAIPSYAGAQSHTATASTATSAGSSAGGNSSTTGSSSTTTITDTNFSGSFSNASNTSAVSGDGQAIGLSSQFSGASSQIAVAHNPAGPQYRTQINNSSYTYNTTGVASMRTGDALNGPTPTPTPVPAQPVQWGTQPGVSPSSGTVNSWPSGQNRGSGSGSEDSGAGLSQANGGLGGVVQGSPIVNVNVFARWPNAVTEPMPSQSLLLNWPSDGLSKVDWPGGIWPGADVSGSYGSVSALVGGASGAGKYVDGVFTRPGSDIYGVIGDIDPLSGAIIPAAVPMPQDLVPSFAPVHVGTSRSLWSLAPTYPGQSRLGLVVSELLLAVACAALVWMKMDRAEHRFVWLRGVAQYGLGLFVLLVAVLWRR